MADNVVLIVDDDPTMQVILPSMIEAVGGVPHIVDGGREALRVLNDKEQKTDIVLMDQNMLDLSGLDVVKELRACETCAHVPIIIQSGSTHVKDVKTAIDVGASYYLSKPFEELSVKNAIEYTMQSIEQYNALNQKLSGGTLPGRSLRSASFIMEKYEQVENIAVLISSMFTDPMRVFFGVKAVLVNAIEHGVLDIGAEEKSDIFAKKMFEDEIERREGLKKNRGKEVEVQFVRKKGRCSLRITDPGMGFDWKSHMKFDTDRKSYNSGYGIMKALRCFDEVKYNTAGNQVMVSTFDDE